MKYVVELNGEVVLETAMFLSFVDKLPKIMKDANLYQGEDFCDWMVNEAIAGQRPGVVAYNKGMIECYKYVGA